MYVGRYVTTSEEGNVDRNSYDSLCKIFFRCQQSDARRKDLKIQKRREWSESRTRCLEVSAGELRRLCRSSVVGRSMVVFRRVVCWGLLGCLGQLLRQAASSERYQHQISCSTRTFHPEGEKVRGHPCIFDTDLVTGARPARHEGARMFKPVRLRGTG